MRVSGRAGSFGPCFRPSSDDAIPGGGGCDPAGDEPDRFYIVADGEVDVVRHTAEGADIPLATLRRGEVFGEIGILEETRRTADVRARSDVEVLALDWRDFKDLLDTSDPTARDFMRIVEQRRAALPA